MNGETLLFLICMTTALLLICAAIIIGLKRGLGSINEYLILAVYARGVRDGFKEANTHKK